MPRFPQAEPEIAALAALVAEGLEQAAEDFPTPPVPATELRAKLDTYAQTRAATVVAETAFREQHAEKDEALEDLVDSTKANLKYAEFAVGDRTQKLKQLGWAPRRSGTALESPGEVRNIKLVGEGDSWVVLRWESPSEGGKPAFYKIHGLAGDQWDPVETSTSTEQLMSNQPRGVDLHFRVTAVNNAGEGPPSATVTDGLQTRHSANGMNNRSLPLQHSVDRRFLVLTEDDHARAFERLAAPGGLGPAARPSNAPRNWTSITYRPAIRTGSSGVRRSTSTRKEKPSRRSPMRRSSLSSVEIRSIDLGQIRKRVDEYASGLFRSRPEVEEIVVFGSFADGTYAPGSDLDVFLLLSESAKDVWDRVPDYLPGAFPVGIDIFPYTLREIESLRPSSLLDAVDASEWRYRRD